MNTSQGLCLLHNKNKVPNAAREFRPYLASLRRPFFFPTRISVRYASISDPKDKLPMSVMPAFKQPEEKETAEK